MFRAAMCKSSWAQESRDIFAFLFFSFLFFLLKTNTKKTPPKSAMMKFTQPAYSSHLWLWLNRSDHWRRPQSLSCCFQYIQIQCLQPFVFSPRMCLPLSIHNAMTSIKLWHFSQITWAAISMFQRGDTQIDMGLRYNLWFIHQVCINVMFFHKRRG